MVTLYERTFFGRLLLSRLLLGRLFLGTLFLCQLTFCLPTLGSEEGAFRICTDANPWYPFTFERNGESKGLHVDIVKLACKEAALECEFQPLPWKRCLLSVKNGKMDAVVSASYNSDRSSYMDYPPIEASYHKSPWRITQAEYVVVTLANNKYDFDGDLSTLPTPVIAPSGYSIINDLEKAGLKVTGYSKNMAMFKALLRTNVGSAISLTPIPDFLESANVFVDRLKIHTKPIISKSYFVAISKKTLLSNASKLALWKSVVAIREDKDRFHRLLQKYQ